jgi:hypothetical protein
MTSQAILLQLLSFNSNVRHHALRGVKRVAHGLHVASSFCTALSPISLQLQNTACLGAERLNLMKSLR